MIDSPPIYRVVLTGGPCGGKTTSLSLITERFQARGWRVFVVPESSTILQRGGINFYNLTSEQIFQFQTSIVKLMLCLEDEIYNIAKYCGEKSIILCDRGSMDCSAYIDDESWQIIMEENNWTTMGLRDKRYECIIHLVTAADGAEKFYVTDDGSIRTESVDLAKIIDQKIQKAWIGHHFFSIVDNTTDFTTKLEKVIAIITKLIGEKVPLSGLIKRKFLISEYSDFTVDYQDYVIENIYITTKDSFKSRIRKRGQFGSYLYTHIISYPEHHGQILQTRRVITGREFVFLRDYERDIKRKIIKKVRRSFIYNKKSYVLDISNSVAPGMIILEAYLEPNDKLNLPDFITLEKEITHDKEYSMYKMCQIKE